MDYEMTVKTARDLVEGFCVDSPQHPAGLLLVHPIDEIDGIDDGKWIEITIRDGRKHLLGPNDRLFILGDNPIFSCQVKNKKIVKSTT